MSTPDILDTILRRKREEIVERCERLSLRGECRVTTLAEPFRMSLPAISKHLRVLEDADLIKRKREGREHLIRAHAAGLKQAGEWIARYAEFWDRQFDALDEFLKSDQQKGANT